MDKFTPDHPTRMRNKALELREKARTSELPGYAEQLIAAAEELERYAIEVERRG